MKGKLSKGEQRLMALEQLSAITSVATQVNVCTHEMHASLKSIEISLIEIRDTLIAIRQGGK